MEMRASRNTARLLLSKPYCTRCLNNIDQLIFVRIFYQSNCFLPFLPENHLNIVAELEINLQNVDRRLPMGDVFAAELRQQGANQERHARVRLLSQVGQNILKKKENERYI